MKTRKIGFSSLASYYQPLRDCWCLARIAAKDSGLFCLAVNLEGTAAPWATLVRVTGYGRDQDEARQTWGATIGRLTQAVTALPKKF
jgi:hypothetical protein